MDSPKDALARLKRAFSGPLIDPGSHGRERRRADSPYTCEIHVNGRVVARNSRLAPTDVLSQHEGRATGPHLSFFQCRLKFGWTPDSWRDRVSERWLGPLSRILGTCERFACDREERS